MAILFLYEIARAFRGALRRTMRVWLFLVVVLSYWQLSVEASAQGSDFAQPLSNTALTPSQNHALDQIRTLPTTVGDVSVVRINPAPLRERSRVTVPLPDRPAVTIETNSTNISSDKVFTTTGRTSGLSGGTTTIVVNDGSVTGSILTDSGLYRIFPLGGDAHVIVKVGRFPPDHPSDHPK